MEVVILMVFLSVPLLIIGYVIANARHFGWMSYIVILVATLIGTAMFLPLLNNALSVDDNSSSTIGDAVEEIFSSDTMGVIAGYLPLLVGMGGIVFGVWVVIKVVDCVSDYEPSSYKEKHVMKKKKREIPTYVVVNPSEMIPDKKEKEVVTSGWSTKK